MLSRLFGFLQKDIAMDLGTANTLIHVRGRGVVLNEPSVVALDEGTRRVLAVGKEARGMVGRHGGRIVTVRPLKDGVIADFDVTATMIRHFVRQVLKRAGVFRPRLVVAVPTGITGVEKRAVEDAAREAGAREVGLIEEPMAAAIGSGLPVEQPVGNMIVDIGGGTTEVAVISLCAVAHAESSRIAGDEATEAVMRHIQREHQMTISEGQAEDLKIALGSALPLPKPLTIEVTGKEAITGIPRRFTVTDAEIRAALAEPMALIVEMVRKAFERTPPELAGDVIDRGLYLAGGGALVRGLDRLLSENLGVPVHVAQDPLGAVVRGAGTVLENTRFYKQVFIN